MKKKINATFEINSDLQEFNLVKHLEGIGAKYIKILPNTDHLKENKSFKALLKSKRDAESNLYDFINKNI